MENKIIIDLKDRYGLTCNQIVPVSGGWLNQLWKITTERGELLVKKYSNKRFNRYQLKLIEYALQRQSIIEDNGVPCPFILQCGGRTIRLLDNEIAYMVMEFCSGKLENPDTITIIQMYRLGIACGLMHKEFSNLPVFSVKGFPIDSKQLIESLWDNFRDRKQSLTQDFSIEYGKAVLMQENILQQLTREFFDKLPKGIAHEDFTSANILFDIDDVSAIVDFDRGCYSFIWHDIGRAILSFALNENKMDCEKIYAFLEGYNQHLSLTLSDIADALRLSWCIEIPWWIQPEFFTQNQGKAGRYKDEILWLTEHWFEISDIICSK